MLLKLSLLFTLLTPVLHAIALAASASVTAADPISLLSLGEWGALHSASIALFGVAQLLLATALGGMDRGRFWPYGRALLAASGAFLLYVAYFFASSERDVLAGPEANDPLWVVACLVGFSMGLLQPGLARLSPAMGRCNVAFTVVWLLLIPAILLIGMISIGLYERTVGVIYVLWVAMVSEAARRAVNRGFSATNAR